jgi:hypothetical protein
MVTYLFLFVRDMSFASSLLTQDHAAPCLCVCYRAFQSLSYVRFGNVFVKCRRQGASDPSLRKPLPSCELVFTASEEAIFVHVLVRRKCVEHLESTTVVNHRFASGACPAKVKCVAV